MRDVAAIKLTGHENCTTSINAIMAVAPAREPVAVKKTSMNVYPVGDFRLGSRSPWTKNRATSIEKPSAPLTNVPVMTARGTIAEAPRISSDMWIAPSPPGLISIVYGEARCGIPTREAKYGP